MERRLYRLDLVQAPPAPGVPPGCRFLEPSVEYVQPLSVLMLEAFSRSVDYRGENEREYARNLVSFFSHDPLVSSSGVARLDDELAGASLVSGSDDSACIHLLVVRPLHQRRGIGRALLGRSLHSLFDRGFRRVYADILEGNQPSERLFAQAGFRPAELFTKPVEAQIEQVMELGRRQGGLRYEEVSERLMDTPVDRGDLDRLFRRLQDEGIPLTD